MRREKFRRESEGNKAGMRAKGVRRRIEEDKRSKRERGGDKMIRKMDGG